MYLYCVLRHTYSPYIPLSLHDALPILGQTACASAAMPGFPAAAGRAPAPSGPASSRPQLRPSGYSGADEDRKSTRLKSSHVAISFVVFLLKNINTDIYMLHDC